MSTKYDSDIVAWSNEQSQFIRAGKFDLLDLANLAEEIEDVGKSEKRELASRMALLLSHLLKWKFQPLFRGNSWSQTIKVQRKGINRAIEETPSLRISLTSKIWIEGAWDDAVALAMKETGIVSFPDACPWEIQDVLTEGWLPLET